MNAEKFVSFDVFGNGCGYVDIFRRIRCAMAESFPSCVLMVKPIQVKALELLLVDVVPLGLLTVALSVSIGVLTVCRFDILSVCLSVDVPACHFCRSNCLSF